MYLRAVIDIEFGIFDKAISGRWGLVQHAV